MLQRVLRNLWLKDNINRQMLIFHADLHPVEERFKCWNQWATESVSVHIIIRLSLCAGKCAFTCVCDLFTSRRWGRSDGFHALRGWVAGLWIWCPARPCTERWRWLLSWPAACSCHTNNTILVFYSLRKHFQSYKDASLCFSHMTMRFAVLECSFNSSFSRIWRLLWTNKQTNTIKYIFQKI